MSNIEAELHAGCHSCQLRAGNQGYNWHGLTKIGQWKIWKTFLVEWASISAGTFKSQGQNTGIQAGCGGGDIVLAYFWPLSTYLALFKRHSVLSIVANYVCSFSSRVQSIF